MLKEIYIEGHNIGHMHAYYIILAMYLTLKNALLVMNKFYMKVILKDVMAMYFIHYEVRKVTLKNVLLAMNFI